MKTVKLVSASVIALVTLNISNASSFRDLQICSSSDNMISKPMTYNVKKITEDDNISTSSLETTNSNCDLIKETKSVLKDVKAQLSESDRISNLKKNLTGNTITINSESPNSFSIGPSKKNTTTIVSNNKNKEILNATNPDSFSIGPTYKNSRTEEKRKLERAIINKMDKYADKYLEKKNTKVFVYNSEYQLKKYIEEANKSKFNGKIIYLDKQLINSALRDVSKNKPEYKKILRNNINYNILIDLFKLEAKYDRKVFNMIAEELDAHGFDLKVYEKIIEIYEKTYNRTIELQRNTLPAGKQPDNNNNKNFEISHPNSFGFDNKLQKTNATSFSIIGNKKNTENEYKKYDNLKIDNNTYLHEVKNNLSKLDEDEKSELLDNISETLIDKEKNGELPSNFKIKDKSVAQYFKYVNPQDQTQQLIDILYTLNVFNLNSLVMSSVFNPFFVYNMMDFILSPWLKPTVIVNQTPNTRSLTLISTSLTTPIVSLFSRGFSLLPTFNMKPVFPTFRFDHWYW